MLIMIYSILKLGVNFFGTPCTHGYGPPLHRDMEFMGSFTDFPLHLKKIMLSHRNRILDYTMSRSVRDIFDIIHSVTSCSIFSLWWTSALYYIQSCALLNWKYFRFRCSCTPVPINWFLSLFHHVLRYLRTLYIVWSLVRRRETRRLKRLQTMCHVLICRKIL